ncbi:MAG: hypothetical protein RBU30_24910, partial [Polyangia bacterium]|nr:hypothetical protein [Polyangia bacterium]
MPVRTRPAPVLALLAAAVLSGAGVLLGAEVSFATAAPGATAVPSARPAPGPFDRPSPGDSRFPTEHPRPAGGLLGPMPEGIVLAAERLSLRCEAPGSGCRVRHAFVLR